MLPLTAFSFWLHGIGVLLSGIALVMGGVGNPDIGFPLAIGIVAGLGMAAPALPEDPAVRRLIHGGVTKGGIRQGVFIKAMFAMALLYAGSFPLLFSGGSVGTEQIILGAALGLSSVGSELTAVSIRRGDEE